MDKDVVEQMKGQKNRRGEKRRRTKVTGKGENGLKIGLANAYSIAN